MKQNDFSNMTVNILKTTDPFDERFIYQWDNCFQWSIKEQMQSFDACSMPILALEMSIIFLAEYSGMAVRDEIKKIHDVYENGKLSENEEQMINNLWYLTQKFKLFYFTKYLVDIYDTPDSSINIDSVDKKVLTKFGKKAVTEFQFNPNYDFKKYSNFSSFTNSKVEKNGLDMAII